MQTSGYPSRKRGTPCQEETEQDLPDKAQERVEAWERVLEQAFDAYSRELAHLRLLQTQVEWEPAWDKEWEWDWGEVNAQAVEVVAADVSNS